MESSSRRHGQQALVVAAQEHPAGRLALCQPRAASQFASLSDDDWSRGSAFGSWSRVYKPKQSTTLLAKSKQLKSRFRFQNLSAHGAISLQPLKTRMNGINAYKP